jgi:hypothetical protein
MRPAVLAGFNPQWPNLISAVGQFEMRISRPCCAKSLKYIFVRSRIAELALAYHLPTAVFDLEMIRAGGLVFYGSSIVTTFRRTAGYVDKIFRGQSPQIYRSNKQPDLNWRSI